MLPAVTLLRRMLTLQVATGLAFLVSACGAPVPAVTTTFATAHATVQAWWPKHEAAFTTADPALLPALYAGPGLDEAEGEMAVAQLKGSVHKYPRPFRSSVIFAPTGAPWFLAIVQYAPVDQDGRAEPISMAYPGLIFNRVGGTWKAIIANVQAPIPHGALGNGDAALAAPLADDRYILAAGSVAPSYATYLNSLRSGQPGEGPFDTGLNSFSDAVTRLMWPPGSIATAKFDFSVDTAQAAAYSITTGITNVPEVVVFVLRRSVVIRARQGCLVRRVADPWNDIVPAGSYASVTINSVVVLAASIPLNDGDTSQGRKVIDISGSVNDTSASTAKC
jgi:hypothetical protein